MRKPLDQRAIIVMVSLCAMWGFQQVAMKAVAEVIHPVLQVGVRYAIAFFMLLGLIIWREKDFWRADGTFWPGFLAGSAFAIEFMFIAWGLSHTTASHMVVFLYTLPVFLALGLHFFIPGEQLAPHQWLGVSLAFVGVVFAFAGSLINLEGKDALRILFGDMLGIVAAILWSANTLIVRATVLSDATPIKTLSYQLGCAGLLLPVVGYWVFQPGPLEMTGLAWASMAYQTLLVAFGSLLAWYWLIRHYLASRVAVFTFLTPLLGVAFGVWLLDDPLEPGFVVGAVLVCVGITVVNRTRQ